MWAINIHMSSSVSQPCSQNYQNLFPMISKRKSNVSLIKKTSKPSHNITCFRQTVLNQMHDKIKVYKSKFNLTDDKGAPCHQKRLWYNTTLSLKVNCITYNTLPKITKMLSSSYNMKRFVKISHTYRSQKGNTQGND